MVIFTFLLFSNHFIKFSPISRNSIILFLRELKLSCEISFFCMISSEFFRIYFNSEVFAGISNSIYTFHDYTQFSGSINIFNLKRVLLVNEGSKGIVVLEKVNRVKLKRGNNKIC